MIVRFLDGGVRHSQDVVRHGLKSLAFTHVFHH